MAIEQHRHAQHEVARWVDRETKAARERDAALREVAGAKRALADYDRACAQVSSLTVENAELKARITTLEAMKP